MYDVSGDEYSYIAELKGCVGGARGRPVCHQRFTCPALPAPASAAHRDDPPHHPYSGMRGLCGK